MNTPSQSVRIVEVGLRDGLQNESTFVSVETRHLLLRKLVDAGLRNLEVGSFVSPRWVPAMEPSEELFARALKDQADGIIPSETAMSALVPNDKGLEAVLRLGVREIAVFAACSETFSQKNTNCSIDESFKRLSSVMQRAAQEGIRVRGYLSTCFGCPFEGPVRLEAVATNVERLLAMGAYEVSLGDTIGLASAGDVEKLLEHLLRRVPATLLAGHFHDTRGQAVGNVLRAYQMGLRVFDSSIGGLGGCPYAPGATGNVATEDLVFLFNSLSVSTGLDLQRLLDVNQWLSQQMNKPLPSRVGLAAKQGVTQQRTCFL